MDAIMIQICGPGDWAPPPKIETSKSIAPEEGANGAEAEGGTGRAS